MLEMHVYAGSACHLDVTFDDSQFGVFRNAGHTESARDRAVVDRTGVVMFAMLNQVQTGLLDIGEYLVKNLRGDGGTVVADGGHRMGQLVGVLPIIAMPRQVADPVGHIGSLLAGTTLGRTYAQIVADRQFHIMGRFVMLQIIDDGIVTGIKHLGSALLTGSDLHAIHGGNGVRHDEYVRVAT